MFRLASLLVLALGVALARHHNHHSNDAQTQPISVEQQRRICADLCRGGLGGEPCGEVCFDLMPRGIPLQLPGDTKQIQSVATRPNVCPVLCENQLGYPLCDCATLVNSDNHVKTKKKFRVNFAKICDHYCQHEQWLLRGCPDCKNATERQDGLHALFKQDGVAGINKMVAATGNRFMASSAAGKVDWGKWCNQQCANSNGGSACQCDILPFSL